VVGHRVVLRVGAHSASAFGRGNRDRRERSSVVLLKNGAEIVFLTNGTRCLKRLAAKYAKCAEHRKGAWPNYIRRSAAGKISSNWPSPEEIGIGIEHLKRL
jgi:hypothetical protein